MNQGAGRRVLIKKTACKKSHVTVPLKGIVSRVIDGLKAVNGWTGRFKKIYWRKPILIL
jgi:hypothetical protein